MGLRRSVWAVSAFSILTLPSTLGYTTTIERRELGHVLYPPDSLEARATSPPPAAPAGGSTRITNIQNSQYVANVTIGGGLYTVILDTGSSDLWVTGSVKNGTNTGSSTSIQYAIGEAAGDIYTSQVEFAGFTVPSQAFIAVQNVSSFGSISALGINGLAGIGPGASSEIRDTIGESKGDTMLDQIFQLNKTSENYISFLLNRANDPGSLPSGQFTISEIVPGYENITSQPQLPISITSDSDNSQHWSVILDGITGPDGQGIEIESIVDHVGDGHLVVVLDSGFTLPQVERYISDAIYGKVQGAEYDKKNGWWLIPCAQELNISFTFSGVTFPVHPLDASSSDYAAAFSNGSPACVGLFQPISTAFSLKGSFDMILGEGFLRNAYTYLNWGNFVDDTTGARGAPYAQLLPITSPSSAHKDFVKVRLGGVDTTGDSQYTLLKNGQKSPVSPGERVQHLEGFAYRNETALAVGVTIGILVVLAISSYMGWRRYKAKVARRRARLANKGGMLPLASTTSLPSTNNHGRKRSVVTGHAVQMNDMTSYQDPYYSKQQYS